MNQREIVCIVCPNSCVMQVDTQTSPISISGNKCSKGKEFAEKEITNPVRIQELPCPACTSFCGNSQRQAV